MKGFKKKYPSVYKEFLLNETPEEDRKYFANRDEQYASGVEDDIDDLFFAGDKEGLAARGVTYNPDAGNPLKDDRPMLPKHEKDGEYYYKWSEVKTNEYSLPEDLKVFSGASGNDLLHSTAAWNELREFGFTPSELKKYMLVNKKISTKDLVDDLRAMMKIIKTIEGNEKQFSFLVYLLGLLSWSAEFAAGTGGAFGTALMILAFFLKGVSTAGEKIILARDYEDAQTDEDLPEPDPSEESIISKGMRIFRKLYREHVKPESFKPRHVEAYAYLGFADRFENLSFKHVDGHVEPNATDINRDLEDLIYANDGGMMRHFLFKHQTFINGRYEAAKQQLESKKADPEIFKDQVNLMKRAIRTVYSHTPEDVKKYKIETLQKNLDYTIDADDIAKFKSVTKALFSINTCILMVKEVLHRRLEKTGFELGESKKPIDPLTKSYHPEYFPWLLKKLETLKDFINSSHNFGRTKAINQAIVKMGRFEGWTTAELQRFIFMWYTPNVEDNSEDFKNVEEQLPVKDKDWEPSKNLHGSGYKRIGYEEILINNNYNKLIEHELIDWSQFFKDIYNSPEKGKRLINWVYKTLGTRSGSFRFLKFRVDALKKLKNKDENVRAEIGATKINFQESNEEESVCYWKQLSLMPRPHSHISFS